MPPSLAFAADPSVRLVLFHVGLTERGPGVLLQKAQKPDARLTALTSIVEELSPDVLLLSGVDTDVEGLTATALRQRIAPQLEYIFTRLGTHGMPSGIDLDGDGSKWGARDALGYGRFPGAGGMMLFSRYPVSLGDDLTATPWADIPAHQMPSHLAAYEGFPVSSVAHWALQVETPLGQMSLWVSNPTPPVFDAEEDTNGRRNRDELLVWLNRLNDAATSSAPPVLMGNFNIDPVDGEGRKDALHALLSHPGLHDPEPRSEGGAQAGADDPQHGGDPALDTADWSSEPGPGNLRVDYILPSKHWQVEAAGVYWPTSPDGKALLKDADSAHHPVWVDISGPK